ncbi:MAG: hypothetical protein NC543_01825 [bacterium]|nr:hypothetical protein [bacterium]MCM1373959.1 hypothetical protein [Muribaculum sp.]
MDRKSEKVARKDVYVDYRTTGRDSAGRKDGLWHAVCRGRSRVFLSVLLSAAMAFSGCLPVRAEEESTTYGQYLSGECQETEDTQYEVIRISSAAQLEELAQACAYDVWSWDKQVLLEADIDLTGMELMIPVFGGIFDGQGHTVSGLEITQEGSAMGLFRYLQQGAVVRDLVVSEARVLPQGSACQVGILVGRNYGSVVNCRVSGVLEGEEEVGGIAGVNEKSGVIRSCTADVTVVGNRRSGGVTGSNHGTLNNCLNRGNINIYTNDMVYELEDFTVENLEEASSGSRLDAHMDTGGIAGISDGKIYYCTNEGTVGYVHVGYNSGGIVGRLHQGYIQNCTNTGHVLGRKDVGGIAGQMEPFMEVEYIDGKLDELDRELDIFLDMVANSHDHLSGYGDQAVAITRQLNANLRNVSDSAANLLNITSDLWQVYNQELSGISSDFDRLADDFKRIGGEESDSVSGGNHISWEKPDISVPDYSQEYRDALSNFSDSAGDHLHRITDATSGQNSSVSHNLEVFNLELKAAMDRLSELTDTLDAAQRAADADVDALVAQARKLRRLISEIRDDLFSYEGITVNDTSDEAASEGVENAGARLPEQELGEASESGMQQEGTLAQTGGTVTEKWYDTDSFQQGKITLCLNRGLIEADTNVGGIVGMIATEHDLDPEDDITLTGPKSLSVQESIKAVVRESRNEGRIVAKRSYVGGIAGKADFGAIISCESYADVESTGGSYVGGIAGSSDYCIRSCFSTGFLKGKSYVGGIAGMGSEIYYCDAMNSLEAKGERRGAIAGDLWEEGSLYDNCYVQDNVAGIDGIGYGGGAIPMSYEEFSAREGLPEEFRLLTLRFVVLDEDGEVQEEVESVQVPYGGSLTAEALPSLPEREGCYGQWPEMDYSHITESRVLAAQYTKWITAMSLHEPSLPENQAAMMVEGLFYPENELQVTGGEDDGWQIQICTAEGYYDQPVSVRLLQSLLPEHMEVHLLQEGKEDIVPYRMMGSYVVFDMERPGSFRIVETTPELPLRYYVIGGAVILLVLTLAGRKLLQRRKRKREERAQQEENPQQEQSQQDQSQQDQR